MINLQGYTAPRLFHRHIKAAWSFGLRNKFLISNCNSSCNLTLQLSAKEADMRLHSSYKIGVWGTSQRGIQKSVLCSWCPHRYRPMQQKCSKLLAGASRGLTRTDKITKRNLKEALPDSPRKTRSRLYQRKASSSQ